MKRVMTATILLTLILLSACTKNIVPLEVAEIKKIGNLAVMECEFHNVATDTLKAGTGFLHIGEKDRKVFIEYTGLVKLGIDATQMEINVNDDIVKIKLPEILVLDIDRSTEEWKDTISTKDAFFNKNKLTAEKQNEIVDKAQDKMKETVLANKSLLESARNRVKLQVENFINSFGEAAGIEYKIVWDE